MRLLILSLTIGLTNLSLFGQNLKQDSVFNKNNITIETNRNLYSLNYEHPIFIKTNNKLLFHLGLSGTLLHEYYGLTNVHKTKIASIIFPFGLYYLIGFGRKNNVEFGLNDMIGYSTSSLIDYPNKFYNYLNPSIGYRFENFKSKSINFGIAYSPLIEYVKGITVTNNVLTYTENKKLS